MPGQHAKLSASGAHRWLACPGSVKLEECFEDTGSQYAAEGTLAHAVGELKLKKHFVKGVGPVTFRKEMEKFRENPLWKEEIDRYTDEYFDRVKATALSYRAAPFVAIEERVDFSRWVPEGFGTADCILIFDDELTVLDLKYGKGVPVSPVENPQLMLYALGAYDAYHAFYNINRVNLHIVQPRIDNFDSWSLTTEDLLAFGEKVKPIAKEAFAGSDKLKEGDHCRFCKAKSRCSARAKTMFSAVEEVIPHVVTNKKGKASTGGLLSNAEISKFLKKTEGLVDWIKDLQEEALAELLAGKEISGYKIVEGRSNRRITNEEEMAKALMGAGYEEALIYKPKALETITNLEKLCGKKELAELGKNYIEKPQGKPTLVPESDKRPVYQKEISTMFQKIEGE
uniref:DUF2800 domain-containing protein n=1 Tax=Ndongobacter massiliensis TaxID=1871025 RepID=UPI00093010CD|nr:DUF2800 domain-containing protein [Ndongobacter massiliensis]